MLAGNRTLAHANVGYRMQIVTHMTQLGYLKLYGNILLDILAGAPTQHAKLHALAIINVDDVPTCRSIKSAQLLYSLILVYPLLSTLAAKFLLTNPEAFLDKAMIDALCIFDQQKQVELCEFLCKWARVDKNFNKQFQKWFKLLEKKDAAVRAFNLRTKQKNFKYDLQNFEDMKNMLTNCSGFSQQEFKTKVIDAPNLDALQVKAAQVNAIRSNIVQDKESEANENAYIEKELKNGGQAL